MKIKCCRICSNKKLIKIGTLGNLAISSFIDKPKKGKKYPLELVYCKTCTLLQLAHNIPRNLLYKDYWYASRINPVIVKDLKEIARLCRGTTISIGENDGTMLKYAKKAYPQIAVDPSQFAPTGPQIWIRDYWENVRTLNANTITAIACLYDIPNPNKFIKNVTRHLKEDGVFIAQLQTLSPMIELNDVGNICHEHLLYFSYKSLVYLFEQNGLEIYRVERNKINGGSYRIFARHYKKGSIAFKEKIYGVRELKDFFKRIEVNKFKMVTFIKKHDVVGFGASTKMGTIVQYYGVSPKIVVDANPDKVGKYTLSGALIVNKIPKDCKYLWVFPYGFIEYFKKKEKGYKGKWITTIPKFKII